LGISAVLLNRTSPYSQTGCFSFEKNRKYRVLGQILLITGLFALGIAVLSQFIPNYF
jgi:hypothetical protein